jgi:aminobenzoyl-glutamate utilization protein B
MPRTRFVSAALATLTLAQVLSGYAVAANGRSLSALVDARSKNIEAAALEIWDLAEVGYQEVASSRLLQEQLRRAGFKVESGVAGMPTAFIARYVQGDGPVLALLAEFDALPGLSQAASATRQARPDRNAAHACGHNLFGASSINAAIALKEWLAANKIAGELRVYGSPAEEGGSGKVYLVRSGAFSDVDAALHWHPGDRNTAEQTRSLSNVSGKFRFYGAAAHAAQAPDQGRSALDAVEAMNFMVNAMREHIVEDARIHYVITEGGSAPNVVPEFAESYYYVRHVDPTTVLSIMERVKKAAEGAALGTGTRVEFEQTGGTYSLLPNDTLGRVMDASLREVGPAQWTDSDIAAAQQLRSTLPNPNARPETSWRDVEEYSVDDLTYGSTDVGDVSWVTPTVGLRLATWAPGTPAHSWQSAAASGMGIGVKGAVTAAKVMASTAQKLYENPQILAEAKAELERRRGAAFKYSALVGDRAPPLDYRQQRP